MTKPDPKDYPDKTNVLLRSIRAWLATERENTVPLIPRELEELFTPLNMQEARLNIIVNQIRKKSEEK